MDAKHENLTSPALGSTRPAKLALSVPEAAEALGVSRSFLYVLMAKGEISARKIGTRTIIPLDELKAWLAALPVSGRRTNCR